MRNIPAGLFNVYYHDDVDTMLYCIVLYCIILYAILYPDLPSSVHCLKFCRHVSLLERASPQPHCCLVKAVIEDILLLYPGRREEGGGRREVREATITIT